VKTPIRTRLWDKGGWAGKAGVTARLEPAKPGQPGSRRGMGSSVLAQNSGLAKERSRRTEKVDEGAQEQRFSW